MVTTRIFFSFLKLFETPLTHLKPKNLCTYLSGFKLETTQTQNFFSAMPGLVCPNGLSLRIFLDDGYPYIYFFQFFISGIDDLKWVQSCEVAKEFDENLYRPTAKGEFAFKIVGSSFNVNEIETMKVLLTGTYIR